MNSQRLLLECFLSSVLFFSFGFLRFSFFLPFIYEVFLFVVLVWFRFGGKKPISSFFFPPPIPFTQPPLPSKRFVFGSVLCSRAVWFWFLGLSCFVVVLQTHCDLKASVPVPTTIWEGGRGPTAGMLGQKVTAWAQGLKGGVIDRWWEVRACVGCVGRAAQFA